MKLHFLILALNEEKFLEKTYTELKEIISEMQIKDYQIYISDDGSTDRTFEIANKIKSENPENLRIIKHEKNIGPANSIKLFIEQNDEGNLIVISGDNDLKKDFIMNLIKASMKVDFVLSFYINREKKGWFRASLSSLFNLILSTLFNVFAFYLQGPFVWPLDKVKKLKIKSTGIAYVCEINIKLLHLGLTYKEVPGMMNTGSDGSTSLKFKNFVDIIRTLFLMFIEIKYKNIFKNKSIRIE